MKYNSFLKLILFGFICAFIAVSCTKEGPMGPAGANGAATHAGSDGAEAGPSGHDTSSGHDGDNVVDADFEEVK